MSLSESEPFFQTAICHEQLYHGADFPGDRLSLPLPIPWGIVCHPQNGYVMCVLNYIY